MSWLCTMLFCDVVAQLVLCAEKRVFREWVTTLWVPHEDTLCIANCRQIRALHFIVACCQETGHTEDCHNQRESIRCMKKTNLEISAHQWWDVLTRKNEIIPCLHGHSNVHDDNMHCAKSHRPFELFANENCELWNEAKMNATFERGSTQDPRHSPLSAEMNDASTWRIGVSVVQFVATLFARTARVEWSRTKHVLMARNSPKDAAVVLMQTSVSDDGLSFSQAIFFAACECQG